mmetsp:Transcript_45226/g.143962  ORF Transcript_45226/g.143962 Transcript_45226/m.143962 type:complete len:252 (-) Transcript_45226:19-774(-)
MTSSDARGAKQLVVVTTQHTLSAPSLSTAAWIPSTSVPSCPPAPILRGTTTRLSPAPTIAFTHVFWSMRDQTTCLAVAGRFAFRERRTIVMAMPVARGRTAQAPRSPSPASLRALWVRSSVTLRRREDPAALGCSAARSPERPAPCASPKFLLYTSGHATRASRSPTPTLSTKLLLSMRAQSCRNSSMVFSSQPLSGRRRCDRSVFIRFWRAARPWPPCRMYDVDTRPSARPRFAGFIEGQPLSADVRPAP